VREDGEHFCFANAQPAASSIVDFFFIIKYNINEKMGEENIFAI